MLEAIPEHVLSLEKGVNHTLWMNRLTTHTSARFTPFKKQKDRKPHTVITNTSNITLTSLSYWKTICISESPTKVPVHVMQDGKNEHCDSEKEREDNEAI